MIAFAGIPSCSAEQHGEVLRHVRLGRLFELMDWVEQGGPTLVPEADRPRSTDSPIREAVKLGNHSMVRFLWESGWQREWETKSLVSAALWEGGAPAIWITKYLLSQGVSLGNVTAFDVFRTHDDELILMALKMGLSVRGPDGFADALSSTGHSKHLLRLFRELRGIYPDLETEGLVALREAVDEGKVRAAALLTWAGVDPRVQFPHDPYDQAEYESEDPYLISALDSVEIDEKALQMLKALKVQITNDLWLRFFDRAGWLHPERLSEVYHWIPNGDEVLLAHPEWAAEITTSMLKHLACWGGDWDVGKKQEAQLKACEYLAYLGIPFLVTKEGHDIRSLRLSFGRAKDTEAVARLFWMIYERGDPAQRERLAEIVRTPKMQSIIRMHDSFLLRDLGLGPKRSASFKILKRDRRWNSDTYKAPYPFKKPEKPKFEDPPKRQPYFPPASVPEPERKGYWDKWSHFHR